MSELLDQPSEVFLSGFLRHLGCPEDALTPKEIHFQQPIDGLVPTGDRLGYQTSIFINKNILKGFW